MEGVQLLPALVAWCKFVNRYRSIPMLLIMLFVATGHLSPDDISASVRVRRQWTPLPLPHHASCASSSAQVPGVVHGWFLRERCHLHPSLPHFRPVDSAVMPFFRRGACLTPRAGAMDSSGLAALASSRQANAPAANHPGCRTGPTRAARAMA